MVILINSFAHVPLGDGSAVLVGTSIRTFFQLRTLMDYALKGRKGFLSQDITFLAEH